MKMPLLPPLLSMALKDVLMIILIFYYCVSDSLSLSKLLYTGRTNQSERLQRYFSIQKLHVLVQLNLLVPHPSSKSFWFLKGSFLEDNNCIKFALCRCVNPSFSYQKTICLTFHYQFINKGEAL